ncbi:MAG: hypothetical protein OQL20_04185 [Sedimenticola sp.]|nr:hypothetical protein [Sedimenticola sp.]
MTARSIKPDVYEYHYKNGFTGVDAMGWGPNLQYAWSRIGAGITCGIPFNKDALVDKLVAKYGHSEFVHDMNGIMFHHMQSKKIDSFCTADRLEEVKQIISETEVEKL